MLKSALRRTQTFFLTEGVHTWHNDCLWCVDDRGYSYHRYDVRVKGKSKVNVTNNILKACVQLLTRNPLSFLTEAVHIRHNICLSCLTRLQQMSQNTDMTLGLKVTVRYS